MTKRDYKPAEKPTIYFIGVTTGKSSIMKVFPEWARYLKLSDCQIKGMDFCLHDEPQAYRRAVEFIKYDPRSLGALVTTHKIDLLNASCDLFDELDPYAQKTGEVSCISKTKTGLVGHAKDPITSGLALEAFLPQGYWEKTNGEVLILGAGGSSIAISCYLMKREHWRNRPSKITITNRSLPRLNEMRRIHEKLDLDIQRVYVHTPQPKDNDAIVKRLSPYSMIINATGLGKDAPGSPITDDAVFPMNGIAWDFNYRGDLIFLDQARAQQKNRNLRIEDGWIYFIHGWTRVIAEVFHIEIPVKGKVFDDLSSIAARFGRQKSTAAKNTSSLPIRPELMAEGLDGEG